MRRNNCILLFMLIYLPLGSIAQEDSIVWDWKAVKVDSNYFEFHLNATMKKGWYIFYPNRKEVCEFSPVIKFETSENIRTVDRPDVIEGNPEYHGSMTMCPLPYYRNNVTFVQLFKVKDKLPGTVRGYITYEAMNAHSYNAKNVVYFKINIGPNVTPEELYPPYKTVPDSTRTVKETHSSWCGGIARMTFVSWKDRAWWNIKHPFGPYVKKYRNH